MPTFRLPQRSALDLEFDGDMIAEQSSWESGKSRWTEIRIYRTTTGRFVTEMIGRTNVPGERERRNIQVHETPATVATAFEQTLNGRTYITDLALSALEQAHLREPRIRAVQQI